MLVSLSGVDGSGKSTLSKAITREVSERKPQLSIATAWLRYDPRRLLKLTQSAGSTVHTDYRPNTMKTMLRRLRLQSAWVAANSRLYGQQLSVQLEALRGYDIVIADRFVLDFLADLYAANMVDDRGIRKVLQQLPRADLPLLVDAEDAILTLRLKEGDAIGDVLARAALYRRLAAELGIETADTSKDGESRRIADMVVGQIG